MIMKTLNPKNEITCTYTDNHFIVARLLGLLFQKTIAKSKYIKRINYSYNYSNMQTITFVFDNDYKQIFIDIPTSGGLLNDFEIEQILKQENKEVK